jgi:hypothetical protein
MVETTRAVPSIRCFILANQPLRNPNLFSKQVVQNLYDISGAYPIFRIGGSTQNSAVYYPNQSVAVIDPFDSAASDQPSRTELGPAWFQSFQQFPKGTQYVYGSSSLELSTRRIQLANLPRTGLNFYNALGETLFNVGNGLAQCVLEAHAAYKALGKSLYAFEIGNEVDGKSLHSIPI